MNDLDRALIKRIEDGLLAAQERLIQESQGRSRWDSHPHPADTQNARLELGKDLIRKHTGRTIVRDVLLAEYKQELGKRPYLAVSDGENGLVVQTRSEIDEGNFTSLSQLEKFVSRSPEADDD